MINNLLIEKLSYNGDYTTPTTVQLVSYSADSCNKIDLDPLKKEEFHYSPDITYWINVDGLNQEETIEAVAESVNLNFLLIQDILNVHHPTKIEEYEDFLMIILKYFIQDDEGDYIPLQISLILGENYLITFSEKHHPFMDDIYFAIQEDIFHIRSRGADYLLSVIINSIIWNHTSAILDINDDLDDLEEDLLSINSTKNQGADIQTIRRQYLEMKKAILPLKDQYARLFRANHNLISVQNKAFFNDVNDHLQFVLQNIELCRETLASLVDLYISNNDLKMNDVMKRLTVVSTIFIPLTFLVGVWGMNFSTMPELGWEYGYLIAWLVLIIIGVLIFLYFKKKKWY
ncbi:MAG: magnesium/cobalt transporter CorA [Bacteroides sp.]|nr:magnesium/cobalt transporter CorA [Bacteroides sp.]MDD4720990.1 magnesium/cobalt transporter CorA [Bacteroides sp.]